MTQTSLPAAENALYDLLAGYPAQVEIPVEWGDMDAFGHVNNVVYIRWLENGRISYLEVIDQMKMLSVGGVGPILANIQCRYKAPVVYPDTVVVGTRISELTDDRMTFEHRIVSRRLGRVVAEGHGQMVSYDYSLGRKAPLPDDLKAAIRRLEHSLP